MKFLLTKFILLLIVTTTLFSCKNEVKNSSVKKTNIRRLKTKNIFRFEHSVYLYGLAFIPILVLFFVATWYYRKRALNRFGNPELLQHLMPEWSKYKHTLKFILLLSALSFLVVGWANPQWGSKKEKVKRSTAHVR